MGRGAGNTQMERLLIEINEQYDAQAVFQFILDYMVPLQREYQWGPSLQYYLAAKYNIHPTYVQQMQSIGYSSQDVLRGLENLKQNNSYKTDVLTEAMLDVDGSPSDISWEGRDILIIGTGPSAEQHKEAIRQHVKEHPLIVIQLNAAWDADIYNAAESYMWAVCNPVRLQLDYIDPIRNALIAPNAICDTNAKIDYGIKVSHREWQFGPTKCVVPKMLVIFYAMAFATAKGARNIFVVGCDGYGADDPRQHDMIEGLSSYEGAPLTALTKTSYPITQGSLYAA